MNGLLTEVLSLARIDCKDKKIDIELKKGPNPIFFYGDIAKLKQVFLNLIKNGIEAMENGGRLTVQSELIGNIIEATITDDGCGISKEKLETVFEPFYTTKRHGTGLGLSVSKSIVEAHEGSSFSISSEEGCGTTVKVILPVYFGE